MRYIIDDEYSMSHNIFMAIKMVNSIAINNALSL